MAILRKGAKSQTLQWASEWDGELLVFFFTSTFYLYFISFLSLSLSNSACETVNTSFSYSSFFTSTFYLNCIYFFYVYQTLQRVRRGTQASTTRVFLFTSTTFALFMEFAQPAISLYAIVVIFRVKHDMNSMALIPFFNVPFQASRLSGPSRQEFWS